MPLVDASGYLFWLSRFLAPGIEAGSEQENTRFRNYWKRVRSSTSNQSSERPPEREAPTNPLGSQC